jgi:AAHS family 4-hydroxybenzoate transporter-like MFS transporter
MQHEETCNISRVVQDQTSGRFAFALLAWCFVIVLLDGYDQIAIAYAAPALVKAWHAKAGDFAPVFGVGLFGVLVGSLLLGFVGDRLGRKRTIIYGSLAFGLLTMACAAASSIEQMTVLRFLAGIGMGGVVPNTVALVAEYAPRQRRATWVTLMFSGFSVGASGGGAVSSWLLPQFGWQIIFLIGGAAAVVVAFASFRALPESIRFLVLKERNHAEIVRLVQRMFPARPVTQGTRFVLDDEAPLTRASPRALFGSGLRYVTPLLWAVFILNSLALHFLQNWLPMLFGLAGLAPERSALVAMMFPVGGTIGALALSRLVDRHGMMVIGVLAALGCPVAASLGHAMPQAVLMAAVFMSGVCVIGTQFGLYALAGSIYPTPVRSLGVGTAIGVGKFGSIAGSMLGGVLLAMHLPIGDLFMNVALLFVFITAFAALLAVSHRSVARDGVQRTV